MRINALFVVPALLAILAPTPTQAARLGDPAPALKIKEWVKGQKADVTDGKNFYVVEFWATWCGPCRVSIPHLSELQKKLKDKGVVFIGISDETIDKVKPFVEKEGDKMAYTVALDDERGTSKAYMEAFNQNGIPHAFVVGKDAKIIWHGHPMSGLDKALDEMVAGKYDVKAAIKADEARAARDEYTVLSRKGDAKAKEVGQQLLEARGQDVTGLCDFAFAVCTDLANKQRDFALAEDALARAEKAAGKKTGQVLSVLAICRFEAGKQDEGMALLKQAVGLAADDQEKSKYENWVRVMERRKESLTKDAEAKKK